MTESDRRTETRVPVEMWVEEQSADATYFQRSANVSRGGLFLENSVPHPVGTRMQIRFTLPGDDGPIDTGALIVKIGHEELGMHLKFVELTAEATSRIERYVEHARPS